MKKVGREGEDLSGMVSERRKSWGAGKGVSVL
jgi:hypothetical protein